MFERAFDIPYFGLAPNGLLKPVVLLDFFQEIAGMDVVQLGMTVRDLRERGMTWVLRRYHIRFEQQLTYGKSFTIKTWYEPYKNLFSQRVFNVFNEQGQRVCFAWSSWILLDIERMRPLRLDRGTTDAYYREMTPTGERYDEKIAEIGETDHEIRLKSRWHELDVNGHVNHTVYFNWVQEAVPYELPETHAVSLMEAEFFQPVLRSEVCIATREQPSVSGERDFIHSVRTDLGGVSQECVRLRMLWKNIQ